MNNELTKVSGLVEAVGNKFNGSLKVNGAWYGFAKRTTPEAYKGMNVELELEAWNSKGKSGFNIVGIKEASTVNSVKQEPVVNTKTQIVVSNAQPKTRDFDAEARGKTRCQMFSAALQSPVLQQYFYTKEMTLDQILEVVNQVADKGVAYTFGE
jgi:hypothetical protein